MPLNAVDRAKSLAPHRSPSWKRPVAALLLLACAVGGASVGCAPGETRAPGAKLMGTTAGPGAGGAGGFLPPTTASVTAGSGGAGSTSVGTGGAPIVSPCAGDRAFWAKNTAFTFPTPQTFAAALNELAYDYSAQPLSIVIRQKGSAFLGAASATEAVAGGSDVFPVGGVPDFTPLTPTADGFKAEQPQQHGTLHFTDAQGTVQLEIKEVHWRAKQADPQCAVVWVEMEAALPATPANLDTILNLKTGPAKVSDLLPPPPPPPPGGGTPAYGLHFSFIGESMSFDFTSLGAL